MSKYLHFVLEYIWIDPHNNIRSKTRIVKKNFSNNVFLNFSDIIMNIWSFDGSSTGLASTSNSEITLSPVKYVPDPIRSKSFVDTSTNLYHCYVVLCQCLDSNNLPIDCNSRFDSSLILKSCDSFKPWFGFEQEFVLYDSSSNLPLGWSSSSGPAPQGNFYCGNGSKFVFGRHIIDQHLRICLEAGLDICGTNAEVMPGQWEFQIGPTLGIDAADQLWIARFFLIRLCEQFNVHVSFNPKPESSGDWNGSGLHTNFSCLQSRQDNGIDFIYSLLDKLSKTHKNDLLFYGNNDQRLTGSFETSDPLTFSFGVGDRSASVRIPLHVAHSKKGYFEDRRPASDADPYLVSKCLCSSMFL